MAETATPRRLFSVKEYLALEDPSGVGYEYIDGEIFAFAGADWWHNRIGMNITHTLLNAAAGSGCFVFHADTRVRASERVYYLPDVVVTCDPEDQGQLFVSRPCLVVEVLSPSTEAIDRREKLLAYRGIATLQAYLIVASDERRVVHHWRDSQSSWQRTDLLGDGTIPIPCPVTELSLADTYRDIEFPAR